MPDQLIVHVGGKVSYECDGDLDNRLSRKWGKGTQQLHRATYSKNGPVNHMSEKQRAWELSVVEAKGGKRGLEETP